MGIRQADFRRRQCARRVAEVFRPHRVPKHPSKSTVFSASLCVYYISFSLSAKCFFRLQQHLGFLGMESARDGVGITVSYWTSLEAIAHWKQHAEHLAAQTLGQQQW